MFCSNCGAKIDDNDIFCSLCGSKIVRQEYNREEDSSYISALNYYIESELGIHDEQEDSKDSNYNALSNNIRNLDIQDVFIKFFKKNIYGRRVHIFGLDMAHDSLEKMLKSEFGYSEDEKLLVAFDGGKYFEEGFLITDSIIRWKSKMSNSGEGSWRLEDIASVNTERRALSDVIYFVNHQNEMSPNIYLTGIDRVHEFVFAFKGFINEVFGLYENENDMQERLADICCSVPLGIAESCISGCPIRDTEKKLIRARQFFKIPDSEMVFLILDSTIFGSGKVGFAIGTNGLYYCLSKNIGMIGWNEFKTLEVKKGLSAIKIGKLEFTCNIGAEQESLYAVLNNIQSLI